MICMLMHLLHGDHGDHGEHGEHHERASHADHNGPTHGLVSAGERELAELRAEVRWLRALVARSAPTPEIVGEAETRVAAAVGTHHGPH